MTGYRLSARAAEAEAKRLAAQGLYAEAKTVMSISAGSATVGDLLTWIGDAGTSHSGERVTERGSLELSPVWACVNLIAGTTGSLPCMVYRTDAGGGRQVARDHWAYRLLHDSPNAEQTAVDFWEGLAASIELKGNALAEIVRSDDGRRVVALNPVGWDGVGVSRDRNGALVYRWGGQDRSADQVLHVRGFGGDARGGLSTLGYARQTLGLASAIEKSAGTTFGNGVRPSGVLSFKDWLDAEKRGLARERLDNDYRGAASSGKPLILEGGIEWKQLSINPDDAQMLESRGMSVEEICRFFGVPPIMVGHGEKTSSWGTGVQEVTLGFVKYTLRRRLKRIEQAVEKQLLLPVDRAAGLTVEFNLEGLLRGDSAARATFYTSAIGDTQKPGWMVRNEVRRLENLPPIDGWDEPIPLISQAALGGDEVTR